MFTGLDFGRTLLLIRTGEAAEISPVVRVQSNPWLGYDPRIAVDVMYVAKAVKLSEDYGMPTRATPIR